MTLLHTHAHTHTQFCDLLWGVSILGSCFSCFNKHCNVKSEHEDTSDMKPSAAQWPTVWLPNYTLHRKRSLITGLWGIIQPWRRCSGERQRLVPGAALGFSVWLPTGIYISSCSNRQKLPFSKPIFFKKVYRSSTVCVFQEYAGRHRFEMSVHRCAWCVSD